MNEAAAPAQSVLAEIAARLAAVTPDMFVKMEVKPGRNDHVVGTLSEDRQRFQAMINGIINEHNAIAAESKTKLKSILDAMMSDDPIAGMKALLDGGGRDEAKAMKAKSEQLHTLIGIVTNMFWEDVRRDFPVLVGKGTIGICEGWGVYWNDDAKDLLLGDIPKDFADMLRGRGTMEVHVVRMGGDSPFDFDPFEGMFGSGDPFGSFGRRPPVPAAPAGRAGRNARTGHAFEQIEA